MRTCFWGLVRAVNKRCVKPSLSALSEHKNFAIICACARAVLASVDAPGCDLWQCMLEGTKGQ